MKHKKITFLLILLITYFNNIIILNNVIANTQVQKFKITVIIKNKEIPQNKEFYVTVQINYTGEPGEYTITDPYIEKYHNLTLIGNSTETSVITSSKNNDQKEVIKKYIYILKPVSIGQAYFPQTQITVSDSKGSLINELSTQPIPILITKPLNKTDYTNLFLTILLIIFILLSSYFIYKLIIKIRLKKDKERRLLEESQKKQITPEEIFFKKFNNIDKEKDDDKIIKAINLLKEYFEKKYNSNFKDKPSNEIIKYFNLKSNLKKEQIRILEEILIKSDMIKFGAEEFNKKKSNKLLNKISSLINSLKGGY